MNKKIIGAIVVAGTLGLGVLGGAYLFPVTHTVEKPVEVIKTVEVTKEVPVEKIVYQDKVVSVDNGNLDTVMTYIHDNVDEGLTVDYILFETNAQIDAEAYIRSDFVSLLKDNDYFNDGHVLQDYRVSEVSIKKISDPTVTDTDYEKKNAVFTYDIVLRAQKNDEKQYFNFTITIPFEKGVMQVEDVDIE